MKDLNFEVLNANEMAEVTGGIVLTYGPVFEFIKEAVNFIIYL